MEKNYKLPPIVWLKVTDFMRAWLQHELVGELRVKDQRVACLLHLPGARDVFRMDTINDIKEAPETGNALSAMRRNCIAEGIALDENTVSQEYNVTKEDLKSFIPVECPKMCVTKTGVLRPWTLDVSLGKSQANAVQRLLRKAFWNAVDEYSHRYAKKMDGEYYPQIDMIEDFCADNRIPDEFAPEIRREWQRRVKRGDSSIAKVEEKDIENVSILRL